MAYEFEKEAIALYEKHGLKPVRYYYELIRPISEVSPIPATPGIAIVAWDPARDEELRQVTNAAFADHWGSTPVDPEAWRHRIESFGVRLDLSLMAVDGDQIVGMLLAAHFPGDEEITGRLDGWIMHARDATKPSQAWDRFRPGTNRVSRLSRDGLQPRCPRS